MMNYSFCSSSIIYYPVRDNLYPASPEGSDNEMETTFTTFKPETTMVSANPLYDSTGLTGRPCTIGTSNPLYESIGSTEMGSAGAVVNHLYESTISLTGVNGAPVAVSPLFQSTPTEEEMRGEENYGASGDEDGGDDKFER